MGSPQSVKILEPRIAAVSPCMAVRGPTAALKGPKMFCYWGHSLYNLNLLCDEWPHHSSINSIQSHVHCSLVSDVRLLSLNVHAFAPGLLGGRKGHFAGH